MKTILFGLDGATYTVLDHLIGLGIMPVLKAFREQSAWGTLVSTPLPITPQAWTTLATGRSAGYHGIHDFLRCEVKDEGLVFHVNNSRDNEVQTLWEYASEAGRQVTVLNYYGIAPPRPIRGHSIPGFTSARHLRRSSYPADLLDRLKAALPDIDLSLLGLDAESEKESLMEMPRERWAPWIEHHTEREQAWLRVLEYLMVHEPSDLVAIVFDGVDKLQHLAYRYLDPAICPANPDPWERQMIELCHDYFRQVDRALARVLELAGNWSRVVIASDHGFTASHEILYINRWLHEQGLLAWRDELADDDRASIVGSVKDLARAIDLTHTKAFTLTPSCNGIYVVNVPPDQYEAFCDDLVQRLFSIKGPDGGQVVVEARRRAKWFPGPHADRIPDITLVLRDFGLVSVLNSREAVVPRKDAVGTHHPDGILLARGPGIKPGRYPVALGIGSVTPLLAHSIGLPIPAEYESPFPDMLYEPDYLRSDPARRLEPAGGTAPVPAPAPPAGTPEPEEDDEQLLLERLRSLGYVE